MLFPKTRKKIATKQNLPVQVNACQYNQTVADLDDLRACRLSLFSQCSVSVLVLVLVLALE